MLSEFAGAGGRAWHPVQSPVFDDVVFCCYSGEDLATYKKILGAGGRLNGDGAPDFGFAALIDSIAGPPVPGRDWEVHHANQERTPRIRELSRSAASDVRGSRPRPE